MAKQAHRAQAKSVLVIFEQGGISQTDTWDPKPETNLVHRSPYKPISTSVPGIHFTELLNWTVKVAHKLSVVRCMRQPTPNVGNSHPLGARFVFQAEDMLTNPATLAAFDVANEPEHVKRLYHPLEENRTHRGEMYMLARKLIESGVRFVTIDTQWPSNENLWPGGGNMNWDHHDAIYSNSHTNIKGGGGGAGRWGIGTWPMMQSTDWALSGLISDMDQRGMLEETLVCFVTEFGRTPKINERQGRDHWQFDEETFIIRKANWELEISAGRPKAMTRITTSGIGETYKVQHESFSGDELLKHSAVIQYLLEVHAKWTETGSEFVVSSSKDRTAKVFFGSSGKLFTTYKGHRREYGPLQGFHRVFGVQIEPGTLRLWSAGEGKHLHGWKPVTVRDEDGTASDMEQRFAKEYSTDLLRHDFPEPIFALLRSNSRLFAASASSEVKEFGTAPNTTFDADRIAPVQDYGGHTDHLYALDVGPSGLLAAVGFTGEVAIWYTSSGDVRIRFVASP